MSCLSCFIDLWQNPLPSAMSSLHEVKLHWAIQSTQITRAILIKKATFSFCVAIFMIKIPHVRLCSPVSKSWAQRLRSYISCKWRLIFKGVGVWPKMLLFLFILRFLWLDPDFFLCALKVSIDLSQLRAFSSSQDLACGEILDLL